MYFQPPVLINSKHSKGLQSSVNTQNCLVYPCVCVSMFAADSSLSLQGQVGGIRPPLQCRVVVNWFWLGAKSPHRHLFLFSTRPEKETAFTQASHNTSNPLSEPVFGLNTGVNLSKHTMFSPLSHFYNHGIIKKENNEHATQ